MGMNTAMIVRNDFLNEIEKDAEFGKRVAEAIRCAGYPNPPYHGQSFDVLPSVHADYQQVVAIGGNSINAMGIGGDWTAENESILRTLADRMGFRLVKKAARHG